MMTYLLGNGLFSNKQYGFISGRSTSLQLLHMLDWWTDYLEYGRQIDVLYSCDARLCRPVNKTNYDIKYFIKL